MNPRELKKLGFRPVNKSKFEWEVFVQFDNRNYIGIKIFEKSSGQFIFSGLEVEGKKADVIRKEEFKSFSMDEILQFLDKY